MRCLFPSGPWELKRFQTAMSRRRWLKNGKEKVHCLCWMSSGKSPTWICIWSVRSIFTIKKYFYRQRPDAGIVHEMDAESSPTWYPKQPFFNGWKWWNNQFLCNDLESSNWNNHKKLVVWSSRKRFVCNPWVRWCWLTILQYNCWNTCTGKLIS